MVSSLHTKSSYSRLTVSYSTSPLTTSTVSVSFLQQEETRGEQEDSLRGTREALESELATFKQVKV